jgi:hypothetical protein
MKTAKELNTEYDKKQMMRVRPKNAPQYNFKPLEDALRAMILKSKVNE